jgi:hypothetical protein
MKVEITRGVEWDGKAREPGEVIDVKEFDANWLVSRGKAVPYVEKAPLENRAVALENSPQPKLTKRSWKKNSQSPAF